MAAINARSLTILDLAVALAGPLTSPEKEGREHATRLLGQVVERCWGVLGEGELHTLAEFLAARLRDWPCVGAAAAACRALLQGPPPAPTASASAPAAPGGAAAPGLAALRYESAALVLDALAEMLRSSQSFRQDDRSALLALLAAALSHPAPQQAVAPSSGSAGAAGAGGAGAGGSWAAQAAARSGPQLLEPFLGAADGEKDPRCLVLAFTCMRALCGVYHSPGVDPAPLASLAPELADWCAAYFPVSFSPPPGAARAAGAITRAQLADGLEAALASSPFLAAGVLPLLVEKLSSTYRPAKEDSLSALRRCAPAYGPDALAGHLGQLWPALRAEVLAPGTSGAHSTAAAGAAAAPLAGPGAGPGPGDAADSAVTLAAAAASCLTAVARAAGPGALDALALQDAWLGDALSMVERARCPPPLTHGSAAVAAARADRQVLCAGLLLGAVAAAGPDSFLRAQAAALAPLAATLSASLASAPDAQARPDQTMYCLAVLSTVVEAVGAELRPAGAAAARGAWLRPVAAAAVAALAGVKDALAAALNAVHGRLGMAGGTAAAAVATDVEMAGADAADGAAAAAAAPGYSTDDAVQLQLALVQGWRALLGLHGSAAGGGDGDGAGFSTAAAALAPLALTSAQLSDAAAQLCACALPAAAGSGGGDAAVQCRVRWGGRLAAGAEAAAALQQLLALPAAAAASGADGTGDVVRQLVAQLMGAMAAAQPPVDDAAGGHGGAGSERDGVGGGGGAALRLAAQLAGGGAVGLAGALLESLRPLLLERRGAARDEEWLRECLSLLAAAVLRAVQRAPPSPARDAAAAAAHALAAAALAAATAGTALPFQSGAAAAAAVAGGAGTGGGEPLLACWCGAVQRAVASCSDAQQLGLAMEAAECIAAAASSAAPGCQAAAPPATPRPHPHHLAVPLACAVVAGLRPTVLAPHSTAALVDGLTRLFMDRLSSAQNSTGSGSGGGSDGMESSSGSGAAAAGDVISGAAAVALAAAVNRWQDAAALDAWVESAFLQGLMRQAAAAAAAAGAAAAAASDAPAPASSAATAASAASAAAQAASAVRAVGWVARGLALRNHSRVAEAVSFLVSCCALPPPPRGLPAQQPLQDGAGGGAGAGAGAMEVDGGAAAAAASQAGDGGAGDAAAAGAAAEAFGVLVAEEAGCGGVGLRAAAEQAVCRVLWQQRTFAMCAQALSEAAAAAAAAPGAGRGGAPLPLPLPLLRAVAALARDAPAALCRQDAPRLAPLLLHAARAMCAALRPEAPPLGGSAPPSALPAPAPAPAPAPGTAPAPAPAAAQPPPHALCESLRGVLAVLLDWLQQQQRQPLPQLSKALDDQAGALVGLLSAAAAAPGPAAQPCREAALRCAAALPEALPFHLLFPLRQQVLDAVSAALDDNRRSVRQLAVRARRAWGDK